MGTGLMNTNAYCQMFVPEWIELEGFQAVILMMQMSLTEYDVPVQGTIWEAGPAEEWGASSGYVVRAFGVMEP